MFGLVERFIGAKMLEVEPRPLARRPDRRSRRWCASPTRSSSTRSCSAGSKRWRPSGMPAGYAFLPQPNDVADGGAGQVAPGRCSALTLRHRAVHAGALPREHRARDATCRDLWKDVFLFHWKEESQHAILDELEWLREDARADAGAARRGGRRPDRAGRRRRRHPAGAGRGRHRLLRRASPAAPSATRASTAHRRRVLKAYRWQYIVSGAQEPRFGEVLAELDDAGADGADRRGTRAAGGRHCASPALTRTGSDEMKRAESSRRRRRHVAATDRGAAASSASSSRQWDAARGPVLGDRFDACALDFHGPRRAAGLAPVAGPLTLAHEVALCRAAAAGGRRGPSRRPLVRRRGRAEAGADVSARGAQRRRLRAGAVSVPAADAARRRGRARGARRGRRHPQGAASARRSPPPPGASSTTGRATAPGRRCRPSASSRSRRACRRCWRTSMRSIARTMRRAPRCRRSPCSA
ncbi:MAG: hypothetical protein MZW92_75960 [Comamonadaceae bacterium]|nr:hypothetical protein [Comamonadaceae bacterium]